MNFTVTLPEGSTNHGNPKLLCTPANWYDFIIFFFTNYFAHAASVIIEPGQSPASTGLYILLALTLPGAGVARAIRAIWLHAATERKNPLKRAARAGALCMVLKKPKYGPYAKLLSYQMQGRERSVETEAGQTEEKTTEPQAEQLTATTTDQRPDEISAGARVDEERMEVQGSSQSRVSSAPLSDFHWWDPSGGYRPVPPATAIHGEHWLPENSKYYLAMVPAIASMTLDFDVENDGVFEIDPNQQPNTIIASSYNLPKMLISLIQAIWAVTTICRAQGDQLQQYGYAAFGLTVAPYATMSIINTLANLLTPDYPSMFLIRTPAMDKAEGEGEGFFKGAIRVKLQDVGPVGETQWIWISRTDSQMEDRRMKRIDGLFGGRIGEVRRKLGEARRKVGETREKVGKTQRKLEEMRRMGLNLLLNVVLFGSRQGDTQMELIHQPIFSMDGHPLFPLSKEESYLIMPIAFLCSLVPLAIVGGLSGFQRGNSSQLERGFTMSWLVVGTIYGVSYGFFEFARMQNITASEGKKRSNSNILRGLGALLLIGIPTIGGMAVVGMMIRNFGTCTLVG